MCDDKITDLHGEEKLRIFEEMIKEHTVKTYRDALKKIFSNKKSTLSVKFLNMSDEEQLAYTTELINTGAIKPQISINEDALKSALTETQKEVDAKRAKEIPISEHKQTVTDFKKSPKK